MTLLRGSASDELHVDRYAVDPFTGTRRFLGRVSPDDVGAQEREGRATYVEVSEPHTLADCSEREGRCPLCATPVLARPERGVTYHYEIDLDAMVERAAQAEHDAGQCECDGAAMAEHRTFARRALEAALGLPPSNQKERRA